MKKKNRYMLDIETLGTKAGAVIFEIGCVKFGPEGIIARFSVEINQLSSRTLGMHEDPATMAFWEQQSPVAREVLEATRAGRGYRLSEALLLLTNFFVENGEPDELWGNGCDFDNMHVDHSYSLVGYSTPWKFWNNHSLRTAKLYLPRVSLEFVGVKHRALDDAEHEAMTLIAMEAAAHSEQSGRAAEKVVVIPQGEVTFRPEGD